ncbi:MAG: hypothetical protein GY944_07570 [bacterium]|nr:hypothetical protein [bacterium]
MIAAKDCSVFVEFLIEQLELSSSDVPAASEWAGTGNTMGAIGLRVGLLGLDEIDQIISKQASDPRLFGEIAVASKILNQAEVDVLLTLQHFHRCLDASAGLLVEGRAPFATLLRLMAEYFEGRTSEA